MLPGSAMRYTDNTSSVVSRRASVVPPEAPTSKAAPITGGSVKRPLLLGWKATLVWCSGIVLWYTVLQAIVVATVESQPGIKLAYPSWYEYSEIIFGVATVLNLINLVFEDTADKQQLALLTAVIKGVSWHCDHLITSGVAPIRLDCHGALLLPTRYVQWSCSTPTMIFTLWRISRMSSADAAMAMLAQWSVVVLGYASTALPWHSACFTLLASLALFTYVMKQQWTMVRQAMEEADSPHALKCLKVVLWSTMSVWVLFPVSWMASRMPFAGLALLGEPLTLVANAAAKVLFSTSVMYSCYVNVNERRRIAQEAKEHSERLQAAADMGSALRRKDRFLAVVSHELRTPLVAIVQLSSALASGAAGRLGGAVSKDWLDTISGSARHLLAVVQDVVLYRATQAASIHLSQEVVDVAGVVDEVLRTLLPTTVGTTLVIEKVLHAKLPPMVADRRRLVQALSSLVSNAIKFTSAKANGCITVKAYPDRGGRNVVIKVVDNGVGLTPAQLGMLVKNSGQQVILDAADGSKAASAGGRKAGGLGLGLAISQQLAKAHGGSCQLTSPGQDLGAAAVLRLPVLQAKTDESLAPQFCERYTSLGFSVEQLTSAELAKAEGRVCPVFCPTEECQDSSSGTLDTASDMGGSQCGSTPLNRWGGSVASLSRHQTSNVLAHGGRAESVCSVDSTGSMPVVAAYRWAPAAHGAPRVPQAVSAPQQQQQQHGSCVQLSDFAPASGAHAQAAHAGEGTVGPSRQSWEQAAQERLSWEAAGVGYNMAAVDGAQGAAGRLSWEAAEYGQYGGVVAARPSEESLARWEAYAMQMGYSMPSADQVQAQAQVQQQWGGSEVTSNAGEHLAAVPQGLPGLAVALSSALYDSQPLSMMAGSGRAPKRAPSTGTPIRHSIEEEPAHRAATSRAAAAAAQAGRGPSAGSSDDEPQDWNAVPGDSQAYSVQIKQGGKERSASRVSELSHISSVASGSCAGYEGTANAAGLVGLTGGTPSVASNAEVVFSSASKADTEGGVMAHLLDTAACAQYLVSMALAHSDDKAPAAAAAAVPQPSVQALAEQADWETYLASGEAGAAASRLDAPAVVAANARLSAQYAAVAKEAAAKNLPLDPLWDAWVARIPAHHMLAGASPDAAE